MSFVSVFFIAVGLSMDALAVSIAGGAAIKNLKHSNAVKIGLFFGIFQAVMPIIGWLGGAYLEKFISAFAHWIAFALLCFVGVKMIRESFCMENQLCGKNPCDTKTLFFLAVATSIDALAVGLSFSLLNCAIIWPAIIIGAVTFCLSVIGVYLGNKAGHLFENKMEIAGGIILIIIGFKILLEKIA